jgi:hypothetical protein
MAGPPIRGFGGGQGGPAAPADRCGRADWRMPSLALRQRAQTPARRKVAMSFLRGYLAVATVLVAAQIAALALAH